MGALEGRLLAHLEPLKADVSDISCRQTDLHREIAQFATEFRKHGDRLDSHDSALQTHNRLHEGSISRIEALEKEVKDLRAASRSPTPSRAPPSPGARSLTPQRERNIEEELQMAIGGWEDCRRDEAVEEAKAILKLPKSLMHGLKFGPPTLGPPMFVLSSSSPPATKPSRSSEPSKLKSWRS